MITARKRMVRLAFYGVSGLLVLFALLDTYTRQLIFGPTIAGQPLCYWQSAFRTDPNAGPSMVDKALAYVGIKRSREDCSSLAPEEQLAVWLSLIDDPSPRVRADVARALAWHPPSPKVTDGLLVLLDDPEPAVRAGAASACFQQRCQQHHLAPAVIARLRDFINDPDERCRVSAASVVCHDECRRIAAAAATKPRDAQALLTLRAGLKSSNSDVCMDAIMSICQIGKECPELLPEVAAAAKRDLSCRRRFAGFASGFGVAAVPLLIELLGDADEHVRSGAAYSLGMIGPEAHAAVPALLSVQDGAAQSVRGNADEALSKIDPSRFSPNPGDH